MRKVKLKAKRKVIVLNSGGFDSVVLMHHVKNELEKGAEIHSLHFLYSALNEKQQLAAFNKCNEKLGAKEQKIYLPIFDWSHSLFYVSRPNKNDEECYLEWRNLIFLSYAASYAESIRACRIYMAILKGNYNDTSKDMFKGLNHFMMMNGIKIVTPFIDNEKEDLFSLAKRYGVGLGDFFSCDTPIDGKPCGQCLSCKAMNKGEL